MSDEGFINGEVIDDPNPNSAVVGVDIVSGAGNEPGPDPDPVPPEPVFDPGAVGIPAVKAYVDEHPDERQAVLEAERAGQNRTTLVAWLEEPAADDGG